MKTNRKPPGSLGGSDLRGAVDALLLAGGWYPTTDADRIAQLATLRTQLLAQVHSALGSHKRTGTPLKTPTTPERLAKRLQAKGLPVTLASELQQPQ
ncbi:hypothetical protein [Armatimonas sp.]|uniref:hypothetical protein n=1 Tax=Armatimonas sp. TaxID=1872638 RepID=UPI003752F74F